jgi:tRNA U34 5-carboxymethylaminomethyl modifying enzyme MnmG/GidA
MTVVEWLINELKVLQADFKYSVIDYETYIEKRTELLEQARDMENKQLEKLKDFDTWKEWKNS